MIRIYHAPGTRSVRPIWMCYELDLTIQVELIEFAQSYRDSAQWRAISPTGKVPVMEDGGLRLFESGAMVELILDRYGNDKALRPAAGTDEKALYDQWCWFSEATLLRPLGLHRMSVLKDQGADAMIADAQRKVEECLAVVEAALEGQDYLLASGFSAADVMMGYAMLLMDNAGALETDYPNLVAYLARLREREAFVRTMQIGRKGA